MRTYHAQGHRVLADGSIEIEGRWAGVQPLAVALLIVLPFVFRSAIALGGLLGLSAGLYVTPPRRRVILDVGRGALRIEHAGLFGERWSRVVPFEELQSIDFDRVGGRRLAVHARTAGETVYLLTLPSEPAALLSLRVRALLS
jgi:hypothetical protein